MRRQAPIFKAWCLSLVVLAALVTSTCGGGNDVAGPDRAPVATATPAPAAADSGGSVTAAGSDKSEVCHLDATTGQYRLLSLASGALASHLAHGDLRVGTYFADGDGDGYGTGASFKCPASTSTPFATRAGDCNDANSAIHPGAPDYTLDGVDNDCDGQIDEDVNLCACAQAYPGRNWVDGALDYYLSQYQVTSVVCGSIDYVPGYMTASFRLDFRVDATYSRREWIFSGQGGLGQCGSVDQLLVSGSLVDSLSNTPQVSAAGALACQAQIQASNAYRARCGS